jgi:pilus assembly protein CpaF
VKLSDRLGPPGSQQQPEGTDAARAAAAARPARVAREDDWTQAKRRVHAHIVAELGVLLAQADDDTVNISVEVQARLDEALAAAEVQVSAGQRRRLLAEISADILGFGPLEPLLADTTVTEVMVNGPQDIYVERGGTITRTDARFRDEAHLRQIVNRIVGAVGRRVDDSVPLCDARLPDGSRVNVILPPLSLKGPAVTIRKFPDEPLTADALVSFGAMTPQLAQFLAACVKSRLNIVVSGGTGTGKTTVLGALSEFIPQAERVITIEDAAELQLQQPHVLPLESRPANAEGAGEITIRDLVRNSLRMRPDRIVVGEARGPEALDMLQAMNTGHEGSLTTIHANSPRDALARIETMVLMAGVELTLQAVRTQIASAIDLIVQLERLADGRRVVWTVSEIQGMEGDIITLQELFTYRFTAGGKGTRTSAGSIAPTGLRPRLLDKLARAGIEVPTGTWNEAPPELVAAARRRRTR